MSLAVLADHMASKGRGPDSMLIHMSPREVQGLQALAMAHGGSLTVNPETGLPEAGFLDKLLPTILGAGLTFMGVPPNVSAMIVGGIQTVRTGDLGKGISAGLGAYGGANLTSSMMTAGTEALGASPEAMSGMASGTQAAMLEAQTAGMGEGLSQGQMLAQQNAGMGFDAATASPYDKLSKGFDVTVDKLKNSPMQYLKANAIPLASAFGPAILAEMSAKQNMPQTVTKPGMIAPYASFGGQFVAGNPYQATPTRGAEGGLMGMNNGGYSPGQLNFAQQSEPVVRMAGGGVPHYDGSAGSVVDASKFDQATINTALATELANMAKAGRNTSQADLTNYAKSAYNLSDAQINAAYDTIPGFNAQGKYDAADYMATSKPGQVSPQMVVDAANAANPYSAQNMAKVDVTRPGHYVNDPSGNPVALTNYSPGFNINNPTALTYLGELSAGNAPDDAAKWFQKNATPAQKAESARLYGIEKARLDALDAAKGLGAINQNLLADTSKPPANETPAARDARLFQQAGGNWNKAAELRAKEDAALVADPNYWTDKKGLAALDPGASDTTKWFAARGLGFDPIDKVIDGFLAKYKPELAAMLPKDQEAAMRDALNKEKLNEADVIKATGMTIAQLVQAKRADGSIIVPGNLKDVPVDSLPGGVSGGGNTVINPNGTVTTTPDIPGRPDDGFTGMKNVRDVYTEGGGSLGYTSPTFDKIEDFNTKYVDTLKGGTKQSYDYLSGRKDYDPIPYTKDGQISKSYAESVMKLPRASSSKMYIFKNGKFEPNPEYAIPTYDKDGKKSYNLTNQDVINYVKSPEYSNDDTFVSWMTANNLSPEQVAAATGMSIADVYKKIKKAKPVEKVADTPITGQNDGGGGGDANGGLMKLAGGGMSQQFDLGGYSDGGRLLRGPGDGVSDSIPATIGNKRPARLADGEFVVPARIVSELGNGSTEAGARKLYAMMDRIQSARGGTVGKGRVAKNSRAEKHLPA